MNTTVLSSLNAGLLRALQKDEHVYLLGEDILDPYGGAFKVTKGCSSAFPERVLAAPISEAGLAGVSAGMALRGLRPVLEIMFGDFITLTADQLINHISKFNWMYDHSVCLPMVIRAPMGGGGARLRADAFTNPGKTFHRHTGINADCAAEPDR